MGPGRSGTSFLVRLLSKLGLDCGGAEREFNTAIRAGCEWASRERMEIRAWWRLAPTVLKSPHFSFQLDGFINQGMQVEHVFIPIRDVHGCARSRIDTELTWGSKTLEGNIRKSRLAIGASVACCLKHDVPFTLLPFPDYVKCPVYLKDAFRNVRSLQHITMQELCDAFWPLTSEHEVLANVDAIRRRDLSNKRASESDSQRPEDVEVSDIS